MNANTRRAMGLAMLLGSVAANAQSVTFDFTGRVADATYQNPATAVLIPDGTLVTGSFTFTYDPLISGAGTVSGTIGSSSPQGWLATMPGVGTGVNLFSDTVQVVGFSTSYSTGAINTGAGSSQIGGGSTSGLSGNPGGGPGSESSGSLNGFEMNGSGSFGTESWISLNPSSGSVAFLSNGLPNISDISGSTGMFETYTNGPVSDIFHNGNYGVQYEITSLTLAPEIDPTSAASGLTLLLGALVVLRGRRPKPPLSVSACQTGGAIAS
jgi:hypothetical protein